METTPHCVLLRIAASLGTSLARARLPRHIDEKGTIHDCCGFTHAMELSRRKAIEGELQYW